MKWRVVLELTGPDGTVGIHEVSGGATVAEYAPRTIGLTLAEGKLMLAQVLHHAQAVRSIAASLAIGYHPSGRSAGAAFDDAPRSDVTIKKDQGIER